jgi:Ca2+/H+ antiporter
VLLRILLVFVPVAIVLDWTTASPTVVFVCACLAIVPLADLLAEYTEGLAEFLGPTLGGIVRGTPGNAPELIISRFALSLAISVILLVMDLLSLVFLLTAPRPASTAATTESRGETANSKSGLRTALLSTLASPRHVAAGATPGWATQVALVVAPVLVIAGFFMGQPMDLLFSNFEVLTIALAVVVISQITRDGESDWIEGAMLTSVYLVFSIGFYFLGPSPAPSQPPDATVTAAGRASPARP